MSVLKLEHVKKDFTLRNGLKTTTIHAVKDASFELASDKTIALVGESGSGKSTIARMITCLETPTSGSITLDGKPVPTHGKDLYEYRHNVQMVFQDPFASLNPYHTIFHHILRPLMINHMANSQEEYEQKVIELLERVELTPAVNFMYRRPHELSGGQRQRVAIARALSLNPDAIIADEPTSALDVSVRAQILNLLTDLKKELGLAMVFISHDIQTVRYISDDIIVMNGGKIVEQGEAKQVFQHPQDPYTKMLLGAAPSLLHPKLGE